MQVALEGRLAATAVSGDRGGTRTAAADRSMAGVNCGSSWPAPYPAL